MKRIRESFLLVFGTLVFLQSCEKDVDLNTLVEDEAEQLHQPLTIPDSAEYSDSVLLAVLATEKRIIKDILSGKSKNFSGMHVQKTNPKKVYAHYMPWFQSLEQDGYWGQHWTMTNRDPNIVDANGKREIASHYYPLIGPYSSMDPDLQEYHFLLMKQCGIDGVIFDWYGSEDFNDYNLIKEATESFMGRLDDLDMDFSIMYEDRVAQQAVDLGYAPDKVTAAQNDFAYIRDAYFVKDNFLHFQGKELMFVFGPEYLVTPSEWDTVLSTFPNGKLPHLLTLWAASNRVGTGASGEFLWIAPDHLSAHQHYYDTYLQGGMITVGSTYPGFDDFYAEGGWGAGHSWGIPHDVGQTFEETLNYTHHEAADFIQLATWNDFGEGTMIEPSEEFGFMYLESLQQYTGVSYTPTDLQTTVSLYHFRKQFQNNTEVQQYLDRSYQYIKKSDVKRASLILKAVDRFYVTDQESRIDYSR